MESSLNAAHQQHRKAENCLRLGKFDEAIGHHQKAADLLKDAMQMTQSEKALESLRLQHDYHIRQEAVTKFKQQQAEKLRKTIQRKKLSEIERGDSEQTVSQYPETTAEGLRFAIYRTMEENDSLLQFLIQNKHISTPQYENQPGLNGDETDSAQSPTESSKSTNEELPQLGFKLAKDDKAIIEELRMNNDDLRRLVQQLVLELEKSLHDKQQMQKYVEKLEKMQLGDNNSSSEQSSRTGSRMTHLRVTTADSGSPFLISPCGELSPVDLPPLAPLEMPSFDFNLINSGSNSN